jgi:hypothetical protein
MKRAWEVQSSRKPCNNKFLSLQSARRPLALLIALSAILWTSAAAFAGELVIYNTSQGPATCLVDGYTTDSGNPVTIQFTINPGERLNIPPSLTATTKAKEAMKTTKMISWAECGKGLRTSAMNIKVDGPDGLLFLNGKQNRPLNVILYASIPTDPTIGYGRLVRGLTLAYQATHPEVLLSLVLSTDDRLDPYNFKKLKTIILGKEGFDVAEVDTVVFDYIVRSHVIKESNKKGDDTWPV